MTAAGCTALSSASSEVLFSCTNKVLGSRDGPWLTRLVCQRPKGETMTGCEPLSIFRELSLGGIENCLPFLSLGQGAVPSSDLDTLLEQALLRDVSGILHVIRHRLWQTLRDRRRHGRPAHTSKAKAHFDTAVGVQDEQRKAPGHTHGQDGTVLGKDLG